MIQHRDFCSQVRKWILGTVLSASSAASALGAGTIQFANQINTLTRWYTGSGGGTVPVPTTAERFVYGVFWKTNNDFLSPFTLALPLGSSSTSPGGLIVDVPSIYPIPDTEAGQTVFLHIKAWPSSYGTDWVAAGWRTAYSPTIKVTLGSASGPGTIIWQSASGTDPDRLYPLTLNVPLTPPVLVYFGLQQNPSMTWDEGSQGEVDATVTVRRGANGPVSNLNSPSTVLLYTRDMTAIAGEDYVPTNVLVTFGPGETARQATIKVTGNESPETNEQFSIALIPTSGVIGVASPDNVVTIREARIISVRQEGTTNVVSIRTTAIQRYEVQSSSDLQSWSSVPGAADIAGTGGIVDISHQCLDDCSRRFYRSRILP